MCSARVQQRASVKVAALSATRVGSALSTVCSLLELLAAAGATCVSGLADLAGEGDAGDGLYPGDVVVDEDLTAGIPQLTPSQRPEGQDSDLKMERYILISHFDMIFPSCFICIISVH